MIPSENLNSVIGHVYVINATPVTNYHLVNRIIKLLAKLCKHL